MRIYTDNELFNDMAITLDTMPKCEECGSLATTEWSKHDDDGTYYTYRCDEHPETDPDFYESEVS